VRFIRQCLWLVSLATATAFLLLTAVVGDFAVLVVCLPRLAHPLAGWVGWTLCLVGFPLTLILAAAAHEGGHLLAARVVGMRPLFARLGPVMVTLVGKGWRFGWDRRAEWVTGLAVCDLRGTNRGQRLLFIAGGPLMSLASATVAAVLALAAPSAVVACWSGLYAVHSALLGILCLLPIEERRLASDGLALWRVLTRGDQGRAVLERNVRAWS
jgi:hypothetical protein